MVDSMYLVGDRVQVVNHVYHLQRDQKTLEFKGKTQGGRKLKKQQTKITQRKEKMQKQQAKNAKREGELY